MPIEPPDPGKILDALRAVLVDLRDLSAARPDERQVRSALDRVELAVADMERVTSSTKA